MAGKSYPEFDSFNSDQMREIHKWFKTKRMTVKQLAEHWGVEDTSIKKVIAHRDSVEAAKATKV